MEKEPLLPFRLTHPIGGSSEYMIPPESKLEVLQRLYPFTECPNLEDWRFDIHEEKWFPVAEFIVVRENNKNYLCSPFYYLSGGTVIDWFTVSSDGKEPPKGPYKWSISMDFSPIEETIKPAANLA